jgi:hypothetical protein
MMLFSINNFSVSKKSPDRYEPLQSPLKCRLSLLVKNTPIRQKFMRISLLP